MTDLLSALVLDDLWNPRTAQLVLGGLILVVGLLIVGRRDLLRFSLSRAWAISGVTFAESVRKRVLWVTPLAMIGVIAVAQLTRPNDPQDAIRQTIKFCLMATGLVVSVVALILGSTNLPREIENRVIFTIVTKPTTRLEIIIGKIIGLSRVTGLIILIMGAFTLGYVQLRAWSLESDIRQAIKAGEVPAVSKLTFDHYANSGLVSARTYVPARDVQIFSQLPEGSRRTILGDAEQGLIAPFFHDKAQFIAPKQQSVADGSHGVILINIDYKVVDAVAASRGGDVLDELGIPAAPAGPSPTLPTPSLANIPARVVVQILDNNQATKFSSDKIQGSTASGFVLPPSGSGKPLEVFLNPEQMFQLEQLPGFFVHVACMTPGVEYTIDVGKTAEESPVQILVVGAVSGESHTMLPKFPGAATAATDSLIRFGGRMTSSGMQLRGAAENPPIGTFSFRNAIPKLIENGRVPFEMRVPVERSGGDASLDSDDLTQVTVSVLNAQTGAISEPVLVQPESIRTAYFSLPEELVSSGEFTLIVKNNTIGHWIGLRPGSVAMVTDDQGFAFNLLKSIAVIWLLSILVSTIALFCSTFVSWPIAIVLSLVILLGHWGVSQIGETGTGLSRQMVNDMGLEAAQAKVAETAMDALNKLLAVVSSLLPDISQYSGGTDLEEGIAVSWAAWWRGLTVTFGFGIPLAVLAYVFLKKKEVAP